MDNLIKNAKSSLFNDKLNAICGFPSHPSSTITDERIIFFLNLPINLLISLLIKLQLSTKLIPI